MQEALLIPGQIVIEKEIIVLYRKKKKKVSVIAVIQLKLFQTGLVFMFFLVLSLLLLL